MGGAELEERVSGRPGREEPQVSPSSREVKVLDLTTHQQGLGLSAAGQWLASRCSSAGEVPVASSQGLPSAAPSPQSPPPMH